MKIMILVCLVLLTSCYDKSISKNCGQGYRICDDDKPVSGYVDHGN